MNSRCKFKQVLLLLGVLMLYGICAILPATKSPQSLGRLHNARHMQDADERGDKEERERRPDQPDEALRFRRLQLQDEKGVIPPDGVEKARQHVRQMRVAPQSTIKPESWNWIGPGNIGGRIRTIVIDRTNTENMWLGSVGGGIWRTTDGGDAWWPVDDFMGNLAVSTMIIHPTFSNIMYAGTGEGFGNSDALQGAGVFQSTNSGQTWNQLPSTANNNWFFVNRLAISPDGSTILAATSPAFDSNIPPNQLQNGGIWQTVDGGLNWNRRTNAQTFDMDFHPTDSTRAIAGGEGGAQFSTDRGMSWNAATFNPAINAQPPTNIIVRRIELAYAPNAPNIVYASVNQHQPATPGTYSGEVYRSIDGGQSYTRVNNTTNALGGQGWYDNVIWVNPLDSTFVIVGGIDLWRSTNSGTTFTQISDWREAPASSAHADHHVIVAHPNFNNVANQIVFFGNDGGIYRTFNVSTVQMTTGWGVLNNRLGITQFYGGAGNFSNGVPVIIGGAQDNGTVTTNSGAVGITQWGVVTDSSGNALGDGGFCAADPTDPNYFYGEYIYLTIYRSTNGALSVNNIFTGITDAGSPATANFIAPFILDPSNPETMLAGGTRLWRSTNVKDPTPTWTAIKPPVPPPPPPNNDVRISAIAVSPAASNLIVVGHNNGNIYRTVTGTFNPPPNDGRIDTAALPNRFVTRLLIDNTRNPNNWIYATFGGFSPDNIYRTTDNGATWTDVTGTGVSGLPNVPVRTLVYNPRNANLLYAGTEVGVFTSDDAGATWQLPQNGPINVSVDELFWLGEELIAVTHGRGMYGASGGTYVDCNWNGAQRGTFNEPYKTITAALNAAQSYRTIWLKPCTYTEPAILNKRVEFRSLGGTAVIRRP